MTLLDAALHYIEIDWPVVPLHTPTGNPDQPCSCRRVTCPRIGTHPCHRNNCKQAGKHPCHQAVCANIGKHPRTLNGVHDASINPEKIAEWWDTWKDANIGLATGAGMGAWALDVDPHKGGLDTLAALEAQYSELPETRTQDTGGDGAHLLFLAPGFPLRNISEGALGPGLDVRTDGGLIVAAPSLHASGKRYRWRNGSPIVAAPDWLLDLLRDGRASQSGQRSAFATWDALRAELGRRIIAAGSGKPNASGNYDARGICHKGEGETGLFYDPVTNRAHCNAGCDQATILRAFDLPTEPAKAKAASSPNWSDPRTPANAATASKIRVDATLSKIVTAQSILDTDYPEPKWAVKGVLPEGTTIIAGPPKLGKSVFCLNIAVAVSEGGKALSHFDVERGAVLYLALEDGERRIKERLSKLTNGRLSNRLEVVTRWPRLNEGGLEAIEEWIKRHSDGRLLLVDTFKRIRPARSSHHKAAGTYDVDYDDVVPLTELTTKNCVALALVAHTRKAEAEDVLAMVSGSFGLTGAADGALVLARRRNSTQATLSVIGRDVEEQELALQFKPDMFLWTVLGKAEETSLSAEREEVIALLKQVGKPMAPGKIAELLGKPAGAIRTLLCRMKGSAQLKLFGDKYQVPDYKPPEPDKIRKSPEIKNVTALPETKTACNAGMSNGDSDLEKKRYRVTAFAQGDEPADEADEDAEKQNIDKSGNAVTNSAQLMQSKDIPALPAKNITGNAGNAGNGSTPGVQSEPPEPVRKVKKHGRMTL